MRDRRRQGWWVCAFGATAATATATTRLIDVTPVSWSTALAAALQHRPRPACVGYVVLRLERLLSGHAAAVGRDRRSRSTTVPSPRGSGRCTERAASRLGPGSHGDLEGCRSGRSEPP